MLCTRCSHPLKPRADRCLRCFALNPQNHAAAPAATAAAFELEADVSDPEDGPGAEPLDALPQSGRFDFRIDSAPPSAYRVSDDFTSDELDDRARSRGAGPGPQLGLSFPEAAAEPALDDGLEAAFSAPALDDGIEAATFGPPPEATEPAAVQSAAIPLAAAALPAASLRARPALSLQLPSLGARILSWAVDGGIVLACALPNVAVAAALAGRASLGPAGPQPLDTWADLVLFSHRLPLLWAALAASVALAYSWVFTALGGQTPGMWLTGLRLVRGGRFPGARVSVPRALARSALSIPSLGLALFGFVLALVDARGQTLHDKLAGCVVVEDH